MKIGVRSTVKKVVALIRRRQRQMITTRAFSVWQLCLMSGTRSQGWSVWRSLTARHIRERSSRRLLRDFLTSWRWYCRNIFDRNRVLSQLLHNARRRCRLITFNVWRRNAADIQKHAHTNKIFDVRVNRFRVAQGRKQLQSTFFLWRQQYLRDRRIVSYYAVRRICRIRVAWVQWWRLVLSDRQDYIWYPCTQVGAVF